MPGSNCVKKDLARRANEAWVEALRGQGTECAEAVGELEAYLGRILGKAMRGRLPSQDVAELVQESLVRVAESLDSFRGDSAFTTWAASVAMRVAFTELRRRSVRERELDAFGAVEDEVRALASPSTPSPDEAVSRADLLAALRNAIATRLTERQRIAVLALLRGVPTVETARRLGTNQNALYKLMHDARKRLRQALLEGGFSADSLHERAVEAFP